MNEWGGILPAIVNIGFSAVVAWYLLTKAIPEIQKRFSEDLVQQRGDFSIWKQQDREAIERLLSISVQGQTDQISRLRSEIEQLQASTIPLLKDLKDGGTLERDILQTLLRQMQELNDRTRRLQVGEKL